MPEFRGVYVDVSTLRKFAEHVRWRWVLPVIMLAITTILLLIAGDQNSKPNPSWRYDMVSDMYPPALVIARLVNGPGLGPSLFGTQVRLYALHLQSPFSLVFVAIFWFFAGAALEKKLRRQRLIRSPRLRLSLCVLGLLWSGYIFCWTWIAVRWTHYELGWTFWKREFQFDGLWTPGINRILVLLWALGFIFYFGCKIVGALKQVLRPIPIVSKS